MYGLYFGVKCLRVYGPGVILLRITGTRRVFEVIGFSVSVSEKKSKLLTFCKT